MNRKISYAFRDDGVYAIENGQVIAHADTLEHLALSEILIVPRGSPTPVVRQRAGHNGATVA